MGTNKAENQLQDKLYNMIMNHDRMLRELKAASQPVGADIVAITRVPAYPSYLLAGPVTLAAGAAATFQGLFTPASSTLTLWNFEHSLYIDVLDEDHRFSDGASLTSGQRAAVMQTWVDWATSSDVSNARMYKVRVLNNDSSSHTYWIKVVAFLPKLAGVS